MEPIEINWEGELGDLKSQFGDGPWKDEPDKVQWVDEDTGLDCLAVRSCGFGSWCGYVGVPPSHPAFKKEHNNVDVKCHGWLTFSDHCSESNKKYGVCHIKEGADEVWWLGFDCAHWDDYIPILSMPVLKSNLRDGENDMSYKTLEWVKNEIKHLAKQLKDMENHAN